MAKKGRFEQFIVGQDIYGHNIKVNYRGSESFKTRLGALCTLSAYVLIMINFVTLLLIYNDGSNQEEKTQYMLIDRIDEGP